MKRVFFITSILFFYFISRPLSADNTLFIVGGGPTPKDSQVSIERNIIWINDLTRTSDFADRKLLFTAGPNKVKDIIEQKQTNSSLINYLPLSRIFGEQSNALSAFRKNKVDTIDAPTSAESVIKNLRASLANLKPKDSLWFVYNGHGGIESSDPSENTLRLWDNSTLNVKNFTKIIQARPAGTIFRSFMPQCFSGGFARSIALTPSAPNSDNIDPLQCGFYSVPSYQESEGCTISVDSDEYRDYSTFFFAALTGKTRLGESIQSLTENTRPLSLLDAHHWAYIHGISTDVPFSSSEYFLELWQPWYVRWQSISTPSTDNRYFQIALKIAKKIGIPSTTLNDMASESNRWRSKIEHHIHKLRKQIDETSNEEQKLRRTLRRQFLKFYPEAFFPFTAGWSNLIKQKESDILSRITSLKDYRKLEKIQTNIDELDRILLNKNRSLATILRLQRMLRLTTILELFKRLANKKDKQNYAALLDCESWIPPISIRENSRGRY